MAKDDDSDNALLPRGGSLPAPVLVDPLNAMNRGLQTAGHMWDVRGAQAKEAAGQAFLNSIDPQTGQPNQALLMQNLRKDPNTALAAQTAAQSGVTLDTNTYDLHNKRMSSMANGMGQLIADHPNGVPHDAAIALIEHRLQQGLITPQEAQQMRATLSQDPMANTRTILQGLSANLSAQVALGAAKPAQINQDVGGRVIPLQPTPQLSTTQAPTLQPGAGVTTGPSPGQMIQSGQWVSDGEKWVWQKGEVPASTVLPPGGQPVPPPGPVPPAGTTAPGAAGGAQPPIPPPPGTRLKSGAYPTPPAVPPAPGQRSEISGGVPVASAADVAPATGEGSPPSPAVAGNVAAILAGINNARATPAGGTQTAQAFPPAGTARDRSAGPFFPSEPPMGTEKTMDANREVANQAALAIPPLRDNLTATETALKALRLSNMASGPTSGWKASVLALLEANGLSPGDPTKMSETDWRQVAQKNLLRLAEGQAGGRTNMGLETQLHANPNMDAMLANANEHVLVQDLGRMRQRYVQNMTTPRSGGNAAIDHVKNYGNDTDYRGFAWDVTPKAERDKILKEVEKDPKAKARLFKAIEDADEHHLLTAPEAPPKRQGMLMPSPPATALSPPGNALSYAVS